MANDPSARAPASVDARGADAEPAGAGPFQRIQAAVAILIVSFALFSAWRSGLRPACIDFYQFWAVGRAVGQHQARDVYTDAERKRLGEMYWSEAWSAQAASEHPDIPTKRIQAAQQRQVFETYSTPWMYTLFGALSPSDYDAAQDAFQVLSTLAFLLAIVLLCELLGFTWLGAALCALFFVSSWFKPFGDEVIAGNVNRLQVACLALYLWSSCRAPERFRHWISGFILGSAILFKPNLAIVAVVLMIGWALTRQFGKLARQVLGIAAGAVVAFMLSSAYFGAAHAWSDWLRTIPELLSQGASAGGNYAFSRLLLDRTGVSASRALPFFFLAIVASALVIARWRARRALERATSAALPELATESDASGLASAAASSSTMSNDLDVLLVGLGATISVLTTDLVWLHYYVLCVPLALFVLRPARGTRRSSAGRLLYAVGIVAVLSLSLELCIRILDIPRPSAASPYVNFGALLLVALSLIELAATERSPLRPLALARAS